MASNKNQHFVPRCYLRPFTIDSENCAINLYNIDRQMFIEQASVKHQCSRNYFYGKDPGLEDAIQSVEGAYGSALHLIQKQQYTLTDEHRRLLKLFWLLQHLRTEAASKRSVEISNASYVVAGMNDVSYRLEIRNAVQIAMKTFAKSMGVVADLKVCLLKNQTNIPFITSDDPAILTNRWFLSSAKTRGQSFGVHSAGAMLLMPISPKIFCLGYDGDVYSVPHKNGWVAVRNERDVEALNQHQFLNCRANIFVRDSSHAEYVHGSFLQAEPHRPEQRYLINYAVLEHSEDGYSRYRVVDHSEADKKEEAIIHAQVVHARPTIWPSQVTWRRKGFVFTNGSGLGYVRKSGTYDDVREPFQKVIVN